MEKIIEKLLNSINNTFVYINENSNTGSYEPVLELIPETPEDSSDISLEEDYVVKNKKSGNIYSVKSINHDLQTPIDTDENGNAIERSEDDAESTAREMHADNKEKSDIEKSKKEKEERKLIINKAIDNAKNDPQGEINYMHNTIFKDKNHVFHIDMNAVKKHLKQVGTKPVDSDETVKLLKENGNAIINHVHAKGGLNTQDKDSLESMVSYIADTCKGSGFKANVVNKIMLDSISKVLFQEDESRKHQLGDHGIRHIVGNIKYTNEIINKLNTKIDTKITNRQKCTATLAMINHDLGYATSDARKPGMEGIYASGAHKKVSEILFDHETKSGLYKNLDLSDDEKKFLNNAIATHDAAEMDWEQEPVLSSIRLADNTALFHKEKVPYVFNKLGEGKSKESLEKLRNLNVKVKKMTDKLDTQYYLGKIKGEKYDSMITKINKLHKDAQNRIKDNLLKEVDKIPDIKDYEKNYLINAIKEISPFTAKTTLGMWAGQIADDNGIDFEKTDDKLRAVVNIKTNDYEKKLSDAGIDLGNSKFKKLLDSFGVEEPNKPKNGSTEDLKKYIYKKKRYDAALKKGEFGSSSFKVKIINKTNESIKFIKDGIITEVSIPKAKQLLTESTKQYLAASDVPIGIRDFVKTVLNTNLNKYTLFQDATVHIDMPWHEADRETYQMFKYDSTGALKKIGNELNRTGMEGVNYSDYMNNIKTNEKFNVPEGFVVVVVGTYPKRAEIYAGKNSLKLISNNSIELSDDELSALYNACALKSAYRPKYNQSVYTKLISLGLMTNAKSITLKGRNILEEPELKQRLKTKFNY